MGTNSDETRWEGSAQPARKASHDTEGQEDVQEHQCHWQLFLSNRFHGTILKPSLLNSTRTSKVKHLLEKRLHLLI